jgi:hypothetical protein
MLWRWMRKEVKRLAKPSPPELMAQRRGIETRWQILFLKQMVCRPCYDKC